MKRNSPVQQFGVRLPGQPNRGHVDYLVASEKGASHINARSVDLGFPSAKVRVL